MAALLAGCAGNFARRYQKSHPHFAPRPPTVGQPIGAALAALYFPSSPELRVELEALHVLRTDVDPWQEIAPEEAEGLAGPVAAVARRICRFRAGLHRVRVERASWLLFLHGQVTAFDHARFGESCRVSHDLQPAPVALRDTEQALRRWLEQRLPEDRPQLRERLAMGPALVEAGRTEEAERLLSDADRAIERLARTRPDLAATGHEKEAAASAQQERELRQLRAQLTRALRTAEKKRREAERRERQRGL